MYTVDLLTIILGGGAVAAIVSGVMQIIIWKLNRKAEKEDGNDVMRAAIRLILHDRIKYIGTKYINEKSVSIADLRDLMEMHKFYHDQLNGNGLLDYIMNEVKALPISNDA
jgi:hypothetical protein